MKKVIRIVLIVFLSAATIIIQSQSITNITAAYNGENIIITYDIEGVSTGTVLKIDLFVSKDGGAAFDGPLKKVSGNVGNEVRTFRNNQISWRVSEEYPEFISDKVVFEIRGTPDNKIEIQFEIIKGGSYTMGTRDGDDNTKPTHRVTLNDFYIGKYEITQEQWLKIMGTNPSLHRNCPTCPVENVTYTDILKFIEKLNRQNTGFYYRLPTEAEWEFAASSGKTKDRELFSGNNSAEPVAWYVANSAGSTHPVGEKAPNDFGIYDLSGNVSEWCSDFYSPLYYKLSPEKNPPGPESGGSRVVRGGSWNQAANSCRTTNRQYEVQTFKSPNIGLRLVKIIN